jgi:hypothetical protein
VLPQGSTDLGYGLPVIVVGVGAAITVAMLAVSLAALFLPRRPGTDWLDVG